MKKDPKKIFRFSTPVEIAKKSKMEELLKESGIKKYDSRVYIAYWLATEGENRNKTVLTAEEIESHYKSIEHTSVNMEHNNDEKLGVNIYAKLEELRGKKAILVLASFVKSDYWTPEIVERHSGQTLRFSMECYVSEYECVKCGARFGHPFSACDHVASGSAAKIMHGIEFIASAVVLNPADLKAKSVDMAKKQEEELMDKETKELMKENASLNSEVKELEKEKSSLTKQNETLETELASVKEVVEAKENEVNELKATISEMEKAAEEASAKLNEVETENKKYKREIAMNEAGVTPEIATKIGLDVEKDADDVFQAKLDVYSKTKESAKQKVDSGETKSEEKETEKASEKDKEKVEIDETNIDEFLNS